MPDRRNWTKALGVIAGGLLAVAAVIALGAILSRDADPTPLARSEPSPAPSVRAPRIGEDHWHAAYAFYACGERQPNAPTWESGVHTHGDGVIHIHPFSLYEEGAGARLVKWFEYGAGVLTGSKIRLPGSSATWNDGDVCPADTPQAGETGVVQVFVNGRKLDEWDGYIPADGDDIVLIFGPATRALGAGIADPGLPLSPTPRTTEPGTTAAVIAVTEDGFDPKRIVVETGREVWVLVQNHGRYIHNLRLAGADGALDTPDDITTIRLPATEQDPIDVSDLPPGVYPFRDDFNPDRGTGILVIH